VETRLELESPEPPEKIARLVRNAERGCFVMQGSIVVATTQHPPRRRRPTCPVAQALHDVIDRPVRPRAHVHAEQSSMVTTFAFPVVSRDRAPARPLVHARAGRDAGARPTIGRVFQLVVSRLALACIYSLVAPFTGCSARCSGAAPEFEARARRRAPEWRALFIVVR
jgi:hypothetical protein